MLCENQNALKSESSLSLTHLVTDKMDPRDAYASKNISTYPKLDQIWINKSKIS